MSRSIQHGQNSAKLPRHARSGRILIQMGVIIAVGFGLGLADAYIFRRIDLSPRTAPPSLDEVLPPDGTPTVHPNTRTSPDNDTEKPTTPVPLEPTTPANTTTPAHPPAPGTFVFTAKDKLPPGHITVEDAKRLFDAAATFVDSRKESEYAAGHVENAYRIDTNMFKAGDPAKLAIIPKDAFVVVYCNGGNCDESDNLAKLLDGSGYKKVYVMHDGIPGWTAAGHPTATGNDPFDATP